MKKIIVLVVLLIGIFIVVLRGDSLAQFLVAIKGAHIAPLLLALLFQLGKYALQSLGFSQSFATVEQRISPKTTIKWVFGMFFINTTVPSIGASGIALVVDDARREGHDPGKAATAVLLLQALVDSGFLLIFIIGMIILAALGQFHRLYILLGLIALALVGIMVAALVLGAKRPDKLDKALSFAERVAGKVCAKFTKRTMRSWHESAATSFSNAAKSIAAKKGCAAKIFLYTFASSLCEMACFYFCCVAYGQVTLPVIIGGYVVATLFAMASFTPQGIGFVEGSVLLLFGAFGLSAAVSSAIVITYRSIVFWLPFIVGAILINATKSFSLRDR
ncbi:MAG: flippase-like domain-containing protein [bacterium]|nr:flippase-like domain-containing protein [bacterium]